MKIPYGYIKQRLLSHKSIFYPSAEYTSRNGHRSLFIWFPFQNSYRQVSKALKHPHTSLLHPEESRGSRIPGCGWMISLGHGAWLSDASCTQRTFSFVSFSTSCSLLFSSVSQKRSCLPLLKPSKGLMMWHSTAKACSHSEEQCSHLAKDNSIHYKHFSPSRSRRIYLKLI